MIPRLTPAPPVPSRNTQDEATFSANVDAYLTWEAQFVDQMNNETLPGIEQAAENAANDAADASNSNFNPNNYYKKPEIDSKLAQQQSDLDADQAAYQNQVQAVLDGFSAALDAAGVDDWFNGR